MAVKLDLELNQRLALSNHLQQSLKILSLSQEELLEAIEKELLENPLLEKKADSTPERFSLFDSLGNSYKPRELLREEQLKEPADLKNYISQQVEMSFYPKTIKILMHFLVSHLDDRAYLPRDIEELAKAENISSLLLQSALKALQSLEPAGIGGRDLKECLLIQLQHKKVKNPYIIQIVKYHLPHIKEKKYKMIAYDLGLSLKKTLEYCQMILSLDPQPASNFSPQPTVFIQPDLHIYKMDGDFHVLLNKDNLPEIKFSREYIQSIKRKRKLSRPEKNYLRERAISAHGFISAVHHRQKKMKEIAYYLIEQQRDFFEKGPSHFKPLKMLDLAGKTKLHLSTISRTVNRKYANTPYGIFPLRYFFQKGTPTVEGDFISVMRIKNSIRKWIEEENPSAPLTDREITDKIFEVFNIRLLRRSINKYRSDMNIPSARLRKRNFLPTIAEL